MLRAREKLLEWDAQEEDGVADADVPTALRLLGEVGEGREKASRRGLPGDAFSGATGRQDPNEDTVVEVAASKNNRKELAQPCRTIARPPLAKAWVAALSDGRVRIGLKRA